MQEARLGKIQCKIVEAYEISLIENVQRQTLNPIEEAKAYKSYVKEYLIKKEFLMLEKV